MKETVQMYRERKNPKVSVIVPIYNVEEQLTRCLDSLLKQTLQEIEIILLDDGSEDSSALIAKKYAEQHPDRFLFFQHSNMGLSNTRNRGIQLAKGKYIGFVDSDDYVELNAYELLCNAAEREDAEIVYAPFYITDLCGNSIVVGKLPKKCEREDILEKGVASFCNKLFRKDVLIEKGLIPDIWFEDFAYVIPLMASVNKIAYVSAPLYHYVKRENSIMSHRRQKKILEMIKSWDIAIDSVPSKFKDCVRINILGRIQSLTEEYFVFRKSFIYKANEYLCEMLQVSKKKILGMFDQVPEIVFLDEDYCKRNLEESMLCCECNKKNYVAVTRYFAIKYISEHGGFYLGEDVNLTASLEYLQEWQCVWAMLDSKRYSQEFFGAVKNHELITKIRDNYFNEECSIEQIINEYRVSKIKRIDRDVYLSPDVTVFNIGTRENVSYRKVEDGLIRDGGNVYEQENLLEFIGAEKWKEELRKVIKEKEELLNSTSWRITKGLRRMANYVKNKIQ